jgi:hypothetical protein
VIEAQIQPEGTIEHADAAFYPCPKAKAPPEPALLLVLLPVPALTQGPPQFHHLCVEVYGAPWGSTAVSDL